MIRSFFAASGLALLGACSGLVGSTAAILGTVDPLSADPADVAVRIDLPDGIGLRDGGARLALDARRSDTGRAFSEVFVLRQDGGAARTLSVASDDFARLRQAQATALAWKAEAEEATRGSLALTLDPCRTVALPAPDARFSAAVRLDRDGPFLPLLRGARLGDVAEVAEIAQLPACETARPD